MNNSELKKVAARGSSYLAATLLAAFLAKTFEQKALLVIAVILFVATVVGFSLSLGVVLWRHYVKEPTEKYSLSAGNSAVLVAFVAVGVILTMVWLLSTIIGNQL